MLRDIPKIAVIMFVGMFLILIVTHYAINGYTQDSTVKGITETLRTTAIANRDNSARVQRGQFKLNKSKFESDFIKKFSPSKNIKQEDSFSFDYLDDDKGGIKAIKVKVKSGKQNYQATCILNVEED
ncbi:hypothetical protein ACWO4B_003230 [Clostridium sporogenes]